MSELSYRVAAEETIFINLPDSGGLKLRSDAVMLELFKETEGWFREILNG